MRRSAAVVLLGVMVLAGCARTSPKSIALEVHRRGALPQASCAPAEAPRPVGCIAAALRPRHQLAIQLNGSGSCPMVPVGLSVLGPSHVRVSTSDDYGDSICTADFGPAVSVIALPTSVDTTGPITVDVDLLPGPGDAWTTEHRVTVVVALAG